MLSPSDVFITDFDGTFSLYATSESLGLLPTDVIQGLDVVPEPSSILLLGIGAASLAYACANGSGSRQCRASPCSRPAYWRLSDRLSIAECAPRNAPWTIRSPLTFVSANSPAAARKCGI